jgi:hypothetical protein
VRSKESLFLGVLMGCYLDAGVGFGGVFVITRFFRFGGTKPWVQCLFDTKRVVARLYYADRPLVREGGCWTTAIAAHTNVATHPCPRLCRGNSRTMVVVAVQGAPLTSLH